MTGYPDPETSEQRAKRLKGLSVEASGNDAVFFSGWYKEPPTNQQGLYRNESIAKACRENSTENLVILPGTPRGKALSELKAARRKALDEGGVSRVRNLERANVLPTRRELRRLQHDASRDFARGASGNVRTFVIGAEKDFTFRKVEQEALLYQDELLENPKVAWVNGIPRKELKHIHNTSPNRAFFRIARGEIERDRRAVEAGRYPGGAEAAHLKEREQRHRDTLRQQPDLELSELPLSEKSLRRSGKLDFLAGMVKDLVNKPPKGRRELYKNQQHLQETYGDGAFEHVLRHGRVERDEGEKLARSAPGSSDRRALTDGERAAARRLLAEGRRRAREREERKRQGGRGTGRSPGGREGSGRSR